MVIPFLDYTEWRGTNCSAKSGELEDIVIRSAADIEKFKEFRWD